MTDTIYKKFIEVNEKIAYACAISNRKSEDVNLVVVTKGQSAEKIIEVVEAGATILGENYPEETIKKIKILNSRVKPIWHMVGHLQSRKVKFIFPHFKMMHSIDSLDLARKLNDYCEKNQLSLDVLIEVNISGEATKFGFDASSSQKRDKLFFDMDLLKTLKHLHMLGLMTMPPYAVFETQNKKCYNICRELMLNIKARFMDENFRELSMGTSSDFVSAIFEGATHIRVGDAIMGSRSKFVEKR